MKLVLATVCVSVWLLAGRAAQAQQTSPDSGPPGLDAQLRAAQMDAALANARLGLVQVQLHIRDGRFPDARQELDRVGKLLDSLGPSGDVSAYRQVIDRLGQDIAKAEATQRRLDQALPRHTDTPLTNPGRGYGDPNIVHPDQPDLQGQVDLAIEQARLAAEHGYTNVPGSRGEMSTDPQVIRQRTLDHQTLWDDGRYAPARELIDVGRMLELDRARVHYQYALNMVRDGARRDELLHVVESTVPPPHVMNFPDNWQQIKQARAQYAEGKIWESQPFKDADGKDKTVAIYDVSDLLFVPIFPGPSEYNVRRPPNPLTFWVNQPAYFDLFLYGPFAYRGGPVQWGQAGAGGYYGYRVYDIIPPYYYPYEADPMYQYRLAQKRARLLHAVNRLMATQRD